MKNIIKSYSQHSIGVNNTMKHSMPNLPKRLIHLMVFLAVCLMTFLVPATSYSYDNPHEYPGEYNGGTCESVGSALLKVRVDTQYGMLKTAEDWLATGDWIYIGHCFVDGDPNVPSLRFHETEDFGGLVAPYRDVNCNNNAPGPCRGPSEPIAWPLTGDLCDGNGNCWCGSDWTNPSLCEEEDDLKEALRKICPDCAEKIFGASTLQTEGQIMGEAVGITGAPFNLVYNSDRAPGYKNFAWLDIPLTQATLPVPLSRIDLTVSVLGKKFEYAYDTDPATTEIPDITPNLIHKFVWDGLDAYGREVSGSVQAGIKIVFNYNTNIASSATFGYPSDPGAISLVDPATSTAIASRQMKQKVQEYRTPIRRVNAQSLGLGGWMMDINHLYDPNERILHSGSGNRLSEQSLNPVITPLETAVSTSTPQDMAVDSQGNIYFVEQALHVIRKRDRDGNITTVAGNGAAGYNGDNIPATDAWLNNPTAIAIAPNDDLYILDTNNNRIRKVDSNGIITTVVGNGSSGEPILGALATESPLIGIRDIAVDSQGVIYFGTRYWIGSGIPFHFVIVRVDRDGIIRSEIGEFQYGLIADAFSLALDSEDNLYMADFWKNRVFKVTPDLKFSIVAGDGTPNVGTNAIDGVPATQSPLTPKSIAIHNGSLYITDANDRVRKVTPGGIISTVAGPGDGSGLLKDNVPAVNSTIVPTAVAVDPSGKLLILDATNNLIRQVESPLPGADSASIEIPAGGGTIINLFDATGRHTQTKNAMTNASIIDFAYDSAGRIASITDGDGDITSIQRDIDGNPLSITSQDGQVTLLGLDANGFLNSVTNPNGEVTTMEYDAGGLLTAFQSPRHQGTAVKSVMEYSADGLLTKDTDAAGGFVQLTRASIGLDDTNVDVTTAEGRASAAGITNLLGDVKNTRVSTDTVGLQSTTNLGTDGSITATGPTGTTVVAKQVPGPRFGMLEPLSEVTVTTPNGLVSNMTPTRTVTLDAGILTSQTDTLDINGRIFTGTFDKVDPAVNPAEFRSDGTSPVGRTSTSFSDAQGRVIQSRVPGIFNSDFTYDPRGRLTTVTQSDRVSGIFYNAAGFVDHVTDPENRTSSFEYDMVGRITKQVLPDLREINFTYDANGNVASITPPGRPLHAFDYTDVDLENLYTPPNVTPPLLDPRTFFTYNLDKQVTSVTRPDGQVISTGYDTGGRISTVTLPDSPPGTPQVYSYAYNGTTGNLDTITAPDGGTLSFTYDGSLLLGSSWGGPAGSVVGSVSRTYDNDFRITSRSVNGANTILFGYDGDGLLNAAGSETLSYDLTNGLMTGTALGVVTESYAYSGFGEVDDYTAQVSAVDQFVTGFTRDKLGRITQKTETVQGVAHTFDYAYNDAGYLVEVKRDSAIQSTYSYDLNGNRLNNGAVYDDQDRLTSTATATYTYTDNGELLTKTEGTDVTQYTYDVLGNLKKVILPSGTSIEYVIDASNRRVGRKVDGILETAWLYKDGINPIAELDGTGNVISRFVYASRGNMPDYVIKGGNIYRIISDHLGSPRLVVDIATGAVVQQMEYDEWGNVLVDTAPGFTPFGFAGGLYDTDTKLIRFGARDYDPVTGRWTAKDPIRFDGDGPNLYGYTQNDPINFVDVNGFTKIKFDISEGVLKIEPEREGATPYDIKASSGKGNCINNVECIKKKSKGPLPPGKYTLKVSDLTNPGFFGDLARNILGDWGDWRAPLKPIEGTTIFGRSGFFLHGGRKRGSAGCIDIGGGIFGDETTDKLLKDILNDPDGIIEFEVVK